MSRLLLLLAYLNKENANDVQFLVPTKNRFILEVVLMLHLEERILPYDWAQTYHFNKLYFGDWQRVDASPTEYYQLDPWANYQPSRAGLHLVQSTFWDAIDKTAPILDTEPPVVILVSRGDVPSRNLIGEVYVLAFCTLIFKGCSSE